MQEELTAPVSARTRLRLGELLLTEGLVTEDQLMLALDEQKRSGERLGRILVSNRIITESQLVRALAKHYAIDFLDLDESLVDPGASRMIKESFARRYQALGVGWEDDRLIVAMANPSDVLALDDIRSLTGAELKPVMAEPGQLNRAIEKAWRSASEAEAMLRLTSDVDADDDVMANVKEAAEDAPVIQFVNELIIRAVHDRASDIHLEPGEVELRVRFRIDGVLQDVMQVPRSIQNAVISRLKIMGDLNIAERRLPQDGRVSLQLDGSNSVDLRLVTLPTAQGESVVVRVLDRHSGVINIANLGFQPDTLTRYESAYRRPWGAVLVTGPTGSGKSTTLYATLGELNDPNRSIITVEDPVEYHLNGVKQVQVNRKAGLTFANALRSILRADPDVVLVGEIRDRETATIAVEAALTGHVVLSSLHTNDAASTPARLLEMGVEPFLVTSAVTCILAQRLVRRLCDKCKEPYAPRDDELLAAGWADIEGSIDGTPEFFRPVGCGSCAKSGFRGRFAVQEVMPMSEEIIGLVLKRGPSDEVRALAVAQGMRPLRQDGLLKVGLGQTTLEELYRVVV
ncbi:MAG: type pilus assembly protein PilB [Acidimicrobiaceae bacterium]|nr:type pilus assembly protein PilB [Acidimicrobiaceae bacterium]